MSSNTIYKIYRIEELTLLLKHSNMSLFSSKYSKTDNKSLNGNLYRNKIIVEYINTSINFVENFVTFQEKLRYFLLDIKEQNKCIICNAPIKLNKISCSTKCQSKWYSINPNVKTSLHSSIEERKNTFIDGVSLLSISAHKSKNTRIKNGTHIVSKDTKLKISASRTTISLIDGLSPAQRGAIKRSENITEEDKYNSARRMFEKLKTIVYCDITTKEEWTLGKLNSMLLAKKLKLTIDPNTGKTLMVIKNEKGGKTKRKGKSLTDLCEYRRLVRVYTNQSIKLYKHKLKDFNLRSNHASNDNAYHIDHIFSVSEGFQRSIPPYIIGSIHNLQCLPWKDNVSKSNKCSITETELINNFYSEITMSPIDNPSKIESS